LSVSLQRNVSVYAETAERIDVLFGVKTPEYQKNIVLDGGLNLPRRGEESGEFRPLFNRETADRIAILFALETL